MKKHLLKHDQGHNRAVKVKFQCIATPFMLLQYIYLRVFIGFQGMILLTTTSANIKELLTY